MDKVLIEKLLRAANRAPSGDNIQPWRFFINDEMTRIDLFKIFDPDIYIDYKSRATLVAHGAVIENIHIAAQELGIVLEMSLFPEEENKDHIARFNLHTVSPKPHPLYDAIFQRRTNRYHYNKKPVKKDILDSLLKILNQDKNITTSLVTDRDRIKKLSYSLQYNERSIFQNKMFHHFLVKQLRLTPQQAEQSKDGMPISSLGLNFPEQCFFPLLLKWPFLKIINTCGLSSLLGLPAIQRCQSSPILGMISINHATPQSMIAVGRILQRVWLESTRHGLDFQPYIGMTFLFQRVHENEVDNVMTKQQCQQLLKTEQQLQQGFNDCAPILMAGFRMGYSDKKPPLTLRRPILI